MFRILPSIYDRIFLAEIVNGQRPRKFFCNYSKHHCRFWQALKYTSYWKNTILACFYCTRKYQSCISDKINHHLRDQYIQEDQNLVKVNISENESFCLVSLSSTLDRYWPPCDNSNLDPWSTMHRVVEMSNINRPNCYTDNCDYLEKKYVFTDRDSLRTLHLLNSWIILLA